MQIDDGAGSEHVDLALQCPQRVSMLVACLDDDGVRHARLQLVTAARRESIGAVEEQVRESGQPPADGSGDRQRRLWWLRLDLADPDHDIACGLAAEHVDGNPGLGLGDLFLLRLFSHDAEA